MMKKSRRALREALIAGYQAMAAESLAITQEWEQIGDETWLKTVSSADSQKLIAGLDKGGEVDAGDEPCGDQ